MHAGKHPLAVAPMPLDTRVVWLFFGGGALVSMVLAGSALWTPSAVSAADRLVMVCVALAQTLTFLASAVIASRGRVVLAALVSCVTALCAIFVGSLVSSPDTSLLLLGFLGYLVSVGAVFAGRRAAVGLGALALVELLAVVQLRPGASAAAIVVTVMQIATGLLIGLLSSIALQRSTAALRQREHRFQRLTSMAADWYLELDEELRFSRFSPAESDPEHLHVSDILGRRPWEVEHVEPSPEAWAAHRADLEAHRPFRDFISSPPTPPDQPMFVSVSGDPIFDDDGHFKGYWGVVRDVTKDVLASRSLQATAQRYLQLFERSPTPMVAHRQGHVIDSNAAAAQLLGYADPEAMAGHDLSRHFIEGEARSRAIQRSIQIASTPPGDQLPTTDYQLLRLDGRRVEVQITSLRLNLDDGPAVLTICHDLTARKAAEQALRHSQALLRQLFDTTPDVVTLVEHATGRYLMVNERFTQLLGWTREEAIGHSTVELGIYREERTREELRAHLRRHGSTRDQLIVCRAKSGAVVPLRISAALLTFDAVDYVVAVGRDVSGSEQSRLEREAILNNASIGIGFTRDERFVLANPHFERIFGWPTGSLAGQAGVVIWASEEEYVAAGSVVAPLLAAGQPFEAERAMRRRDGGLFWCRVSARAVDPGDPSRGGTIWIVEDITERRQVEHALAAARDAAEAASRAKTAFLANTSHEIRTPLNGLLGLARLAQQANVEPALRERYIAQIFDSAQVLSGIISDILDLSKIEAGKLSLEAVAFDLRGLLATLCDSYEALAQARGLRLERRIDPAMPEAVLGDPVRVRQIVSNYLANALKFTEQGGVTIEVSRGPGELLHFVVSDTGPGIDALTQSRLFRPFVQADDSTTRRYGGTGLGLSICLELATLMGGAVGVDSKPRRGSRFWADLPLPAVALQEAQDADPSDFGALIHGARVLVAEDNAVNLLIVRAMLESWGMLVAEAGNGQQALDAVEQASKAGAPFDAVLMDLQMPVMSGYEAANRLRQRPDGAALPIVALTAAALVAERDQALAAGMDAFLTKPIDPEQLRATLARVRSSRRLQT